MCAQTMWDRVSTLLNMRLESAWRSTRHAKPSLNGILQCLTDRPDDKRRGTQPDARLPPLRLVQRLVSANRVRLGPSLHSSSICNPSVDSARQYQQPTNSPSKHTSSPLSLPPPQRGFKPYESGLSPLYLLPPLLPLLCLSFPFKDPMNTPNNPRNVRRVREARVDTWL